MLKKLARRGARDGGRFAIVASRYNARHVDALVRAAPLELMAGGAQAVEIVRVPGAFEIPVAAVRLARKHSPRLSAIVCLGVILRGATTHAQFIGEAVDTLPVNTPSLMRSAAQAAPDARIPRACSASNAAIGFLRLLVTGAYRIAGRS